MSYEVYLDGAMSGIEPTDEEPDGYYTFATFAEAKRELLKFLRSQRDNYVWALKDARKLTEEEV